MGATPYLLDKKRGSRGNDDERDRGWCARAFLLSCCCCDACQSQARVAAIETASVPDCLPSRCSCGNVCQPMLDYRPICKAGSAASHSAAALQVRWGWGGW